MHHLLWFCSFFISVYSQQCQNLDSDQRLPCWSWFKYDFSEERCIERGCCWSPSVFTTNWCFYPHAKTAVTDVHIIQGGHLDIGFVKTAPDIINLWFHTHFPRAWTLGKQLEAMGKKTNAGLKFTAQSYLISLFFDCPKNYFGVICPNQTEIDQVTEAIQKDWITWHAFPFNGEMETMDESLIEFGIQLTHDLDHKFNKTPKTVISQRDVPGMTKHTIPILKRNGVKAISVGVNGGSSPPDTPASSVWKNSNEKKTPRSSPPDTPASFVWKNSELNETIRTFYVQGGYSGWSGLLPWDKYTWTGVPGSSHVMIIDWRGDNAGPPDNLQEILSDWKAFGIEFPNANIFASTFDDYVAVIDEIPDENFPLIDSEIGDSWIHGIASDPIKLSEMRIMQSLRTKCFNEKKCDLSDRRVWDFSRFMLKNGEHTWGLDNKVTMPDFKASNWTNKDLERIVQTKVGQELIASWNRQRAMGIDHAIESLQDHPLRQQILNEFQKNLIPQMPSTANFKKVPISNLPTFFNFQNIKIGFDKITGSINYLMIGNNVIATTKNPLLLLEYRTNDGHDYAEFMLAYNYLYYLYPYDDYYDFDKVNIDQGNAKHRVVNPSLNSFWLKNNTNSIEFLVQLKFPAELSEVAGTPKDIWISIEILNNNEIDFSVQFFNKTATRLPESTFLRFIPVNQNNNFKWSIDKLGKELDPYNVVTGGGKHMHSISNGLYFKNKNNNVKLSIYPYNSPLVTFGEPSGFPTPTDKVPDFSQGASFILHDNIWNTNYIMWWPYNKNETDLIFKFKMNFTQ